MLQLNSNNEVPLKFWIRIVWVQKSVLYLVGKKLNASKYIFTKVNFQKVSSPYLIIFEYNCQSVQFVHKIVQWNVITKSEGVSVSSWAR